jgi:ribonuclease P protein component
VQRSGRGLSSRSFVLVAHRRDDHDVARLGLVASRKVGTAVQRNRAKRMVREWFRRRCHELPQGIDLVVILRRGAHERSARELWSELEQTLRRALRGRSRRRPGKSSA